MKNYITNLSLVLIPLFFGSFLFVGVIESYKNSESLNTAILESYSNIKTKYSECHDTHNKLFLSYAPYAGSLHILTEEMPYLLQNPNISKEYEIFLNSVTNTLFTQPKKTKQLKQETNQCYNNLYIEYDDLAILLNMHDQYNEIVSNRVIQINKTHSIDKKNAAKFSQGYSQKDMMQAYKNGFSNILNNDRPKLLNMMLNISKLNHEYGVVEKERFDIELTTYETLRNKYVQSIRSRLDRGFLNYLLPKKKL